MFTLPQQIGALALQNAREIYGILFRAASETLLTISADPKRLGAAIGFLAVLHTWGQNLHLHPHLHCVVPGGGIAPDGAKWIACRKPSFLLPIAVLRSRFRNVFLIYLREAFEQGRLKFHGEMAALGKPPWFSTLCNRMKRIKWNVYAKAPFGGPEQVLKYLARYTHRVAISNSRILSIADGKVTFLWKDYAGGGTVKPMTLDAVEFIRRFLLHILPKGFVRIRQYGFLANRARGNKLALCRNLLGAAVKDVVDDRDKKEPVPRHCPVCKIGHMISIGIISAIRSPPPLQDST